jgi:hypothetical protein
MSIWTNAEPCEDALPRSSQRPQADVTSERRPHDDRVVAKLDECGAEGFGLGALAGAVEPRQSDHSAATRAMHVAQQPIGSTRPLVSPLQATESGPDSPVASARSGLIERRGPELQRVSDSIAVLLAEVTGFRRKLTSEDEQLVLRCGET